MPIYIRSSDSTSPPGLQTCESSHWEKSQKPLCVTSEPPPFQAPEVPTCISQCPVPQQEQKEK